MSDPEELDALVARAQGGDVRAFEELIVAHVGEVRRLARAFADSEQDADDLAQESLVKVFKSLRLFRYQSAFSTWLYAVVRNVVLDFVKSRARRERAQEEPLDSKQVFPPSDEALPDVRLEQEERRQQLWDALRQVPVEFRTALVLFDIEGKSYDEVAAIEGVPLGTIKSRLARGRARLKRLLEEGGGGGASVSVVDRGCVGTSGPRASSLVGRSGS